MRIPKTPRNSCKNGKLALFGLALLAIIIAGLLAGDIANAVPLDTPTNSTINTETTESTTEPTVSTTAPTEHVCDFAVSVITPATCETAGEEQYKCACGESYTQEIEATGHQLGEWAVRIAAKCAQAGEEYRACACGLEETRVIEARQHNYCDWLLQKDPTCTKNGEETRTCAHCLSVESRAIDKLGHQYQYSSTKQPTTTVEGYEIYFCTRCGNERRISLPILKAVDVDKCGESLIGKVLPHAPYSEFTRLVFDRWNRQLSQKESYAEGLIRLPGTKEDYWTTIRTWETPYRYITNPFPYTTYITDTKEYAEFYCWASEKEYAEQQAVYQRVKEILTELGIDNTVTQKEAIIRINNWICDYKYYQSSDERNHDDTHFSLFRQDGVCHNYALAFQVLCLGAGIECHYYSSNTMNHAWNKVYFSDGSYLWVDCTWNDSSKPNRYLLISTEQLLKDHSL